MKILKNKKIKLYVQSKGTIQKGTIKWNYQFDTKECIYVESTTKNDATCNSCLLKATVEALKKINELSPTCDLKIYSSNLYLISAFNHNWIDKWQINGWHTAKNTPVKNRKLWQEILSLLNGNKTIFIYKEF